MGVNQVIYDGNIIMDSTGSTVTPSSLAKGVTALNAAGDMIEGTFVQEQSDWAETNEDSVAYIKNKPTKISQFENDAGYPSSEEMNMVGTRLYGDNILCTEDIYWDGNKNGLDAIPLNEYMSLCRVADVPSFITTDMTEADLASAFVGQSMGINMYGQKVFLPITPDAVGISLPVITINELYVFIVTEDTVEGELSIRAGVYFLSGYEGLIGVFALTLPKQTSPNIVSVVSGGTGASNPEDALVNLGLSIESNTIKFNGIATEDALIDESIGLLKISNDTPFELENVLTLEDMMSYFHGQSYEISSVVSGVILNGVLDSDTFTITEMQSGMYALNLTAYGITIAMFIFNIDNTTNGTWIFYDASDSETLYLSKLTLPSGIDGNFNVIKIESGGTGANTAANARTNLNVYSKEEIDNKLGSLNLADFQTLLDSKVNISDLPTLSKGSDTTTNKTLTFGGTFTAITDTSVTGHKITDTTTTYTMPSDRVFSTLTPSGTQIPANVDLNTTAYLKVGRYYCTKNVDAATITNCPVQDAFMMEVWSPLSTTLDNETTGTWVYRLRKITHYKYGVQYIQYCYVGATKNEWTYDNWYAVPVTALTLDSADQNGGSLSKGNSTTPIYVSSIGRLTAGSKYCGGTAVTLNNASKGASTASFYAPTSGGTSGQVLVSTGSTSAPSWTTLTESHLPSSVATKTYVDEAIQTQLGVIESGSY